MVGMKDMYMRPSTEVVEVETEEMLALSASDDKIADPNEEVLTNRRRGTWGNLWYTED